MGKVIKKREVFFIHGYDPRGARHYHGLYREHLLKQNKLNNLNASISSRKAKNGDSSWNIVAHDNNIEVHTKYNFLVWTDIISQNWARSIGAILVSFFYTLRTHIFTGLIFKYAKLAPYISINFMYIILYTSLLILFTYLITHFTFYFLLKYIPWYISMIPSVGIGYYVFQFGSTFGQKIAVFWLFNISTFTSKWSRGKIENIEEKIDSMADKILLVLKESEKNNIDETLIIAHSTGTTIFTSILANVLRKCKEHNIDRTKLKVLTLAGNTPMMSLQKDADFFRDDLEYILQEKDLVWFDYTSKVDGLCFPLLDFSFSTRLVKEKIIEPVSLSAKFHKLYKKDFYQWHKKRYKWYEIHFWYLMSHDYAGAYDYFKITAGSQPLENSNKDIQI